METDYPRPLPGFRRWWRVMSWNWCKLSVIAYLRYLGFQTVTYVDDILLMAEEWVLIRQQVPQTISLLEQLGFTINRMKNRFNWSIYWWTQPYIEGIFARGEDTANNQQLQTRTDKGNHHSPSTGISTCEWENVGYSVCSPTSTSVLLNNNPWRRLPRVTLNQESQDKLHKWDI